MPRYCLHIQLSAVKTFFFGHKNLAFAPSPPRLDGGLRTHADKRTQFPFAPSLPRRNWLLHRWPLHFRESSASASWRRPCRLCAGKWTDIRTALLTPHCWLWSRCPGKSRDAETPRPREWGTAQQPSWMHSLRESLLETKFLLLPFWRATGRQHSWRLFLQPENKESERWACVQTNGILQGTPQDLHNSETHLNFTWSLHALKAPQTTAFFREGLLLKYSQLMERGAWGAAYLSSLFPAELFL